MKKNNAYRTFKHFLFCGTLLASSALFSLPLFAQMGTVLGDSGNVSVSGMNVDITGNRGYINWNDFNIANGQTGNFNFNGVNGVILNHVTGGNASNINGTLNSNGSVYVINPAGLTIGSTGVINTRGFVGTTMNLDTSNLTGFLNGSENTLKFTGGNGATVTNNGTIKTSNGDIVLMGDHIINAGTLDANGNVDLIAAGSAIAPNGVTITHNAPANNLITIGGLKSFEDLQAAGGNVYALAINNTGTIRANKISNNGGRISLVADGHINIENATISAMGNKTFDGNNKPNNGITVMSNGNVTIDSSVIATDNADININASGNINFNTTTNNTMANAYGTGDLNVKGAAITLNADQTDTYISVGSNHGTTNLTTTAGDLKLLSTNGGYAQVGYHFRDDDTRIFSMTTNNDSLFSGFNTANDSDMVRLAALYVPTGDINVTVANDLIIDAKYDKTNPAGQDFLPAAHIGHAYLASNKNTGKNITKYIYALGLAFPAKHTLSGNTTVKVKNDVIIESDGAAIARVGHNVRNFVGIATDEILLQAQEIHGDVTLTAGRDIRIAAQNGGTSGIGHLGDDYDQAIIDRGLTTERVDVYRLTAGRHTELSADGTRLLANGDTWHSISQVGSNMMGDAVAFNPDGTAIYTGGIKVNVVSLSGANLILTGANGGISVIGHENSSEQKYNEDSGSKTKQNYSGVILVGYSFNRYKEIDTDKLENHLDANMLDYYNKLKDYFNGPEEGILFVDDQSRIGREVEIEVEKYRAKRTFVGIFGFEMKRDGVTSAIYLADKAQLGTGIYGSDFNADSSEFEHRGYTFADYKANPNNDLFADFDKTTGKTSLDTLRVFYPPVKPTNDEPPHEDPPRWEEPRYPWIPAWFEPCCCPCDPCCDPCYNPCAVVVCCDPCGLTTTCDSYVPKIDSDDESSEEQTPTLAPLKDESSEEQTPTLAPPKPE